MVPAKEGYEEGWQGAQADTNAILPSSKSDLVAHDLASELRHHVRHELDTANEKASSKPVGRVARGCHAFDHRRSLLVKRE